MATRLLAAGRALRWCALAAALVLAGCSATNAGPSVKGQTLRIYLSDPPSVSSAPERQDVVLAEQLAFSQLSRQVTAFHLALAAPLTKAKLSSDARTAIEDSQAIAYLGEVGPGTSADSVGITNALDLLEVSPADTDASLTRSTPAFSGSPGKYYESFSTYGHTFARVVPSTSREAAALVSEIESAGTKSLHIQSDGSTYGNELKLAVTSHASPSVSVQAQAAGADAVLYAGTSPAAAATALDQAASANPKIKLFVPSALATQSLVSSLNAQAQRALYTSAAGAPSSGAGTAAQKFAADFRTKYGHAPASGAIFGYAAMQAVIEALRRAGGSASSRSTVVSDFLKHAYSDSVLGPFSIDRYGDTTLTSFAIERVKSGRLVAVKAITG